MVEKNDELSNIIEEDKTSRHREITYFSFNLQAFSGSFIGLTLGLYGYFYMHSVIGLSATLIFVANLILTFWYVFNDPIIGYLSDRNFKWTKKWGRRFPWIVFGGIPWCFSLILHYTIPEVVVSPWPAFFWVLMSGAVHEFFWSLFAINHNILSADKFRTETERKKIVKYFNPLAIAAGVLPALLIPSLLVLVNNSYTLLSVVVSLISVIFLMFYFPAAKEDEIMINRYYVIEEERMKFFYGVKDALKERPILANIVTGTTWGIAQAIQVTVAVYIAIFVYDVKDIALYLTGFALITVIAQIISFPLWFKIRDKINDNRKAVNIAGFLSALSIIPLSFSSTLPIFLVFWVVHKIFAGYGWAIVPILNSDVLDNYAAKKKTNQKGILAGITSISALFSLYLDELIVAIVFNVTGFQEGIETLEALNATVANPALVIWGLQLLLGVIPAIIALIGVIFWWKVFNLTPKKIMTTKKELKDLKI